MKNNLLTDVEIEDMTLEEIQDNISKLKIAEKSYLEMEE